MPAHSQDVFPIQTGKPSKAFTPSYYVQAFRLAQAGYTDKEMCQRLTPPVRYSTLSIWKKKDKEFAQSIIDGRNGSGVSEPQFNNELTDNQKKFLIAYVYEGNISAAARSINMDRSCHHTWMTTETPNGNAYRSAYESAKAAHADYIYATVKHRAIEGHRRYKFTAKEQPVYIECSPSDPEAKELQDDEGKTWYGKHYYENTRSDMLLAKLAEYVIPGFRPDPTQINNNNVNAQTTIDIGKLVDDLEQGRKSNVLTVDAVSAHTKKLIETKQKGTDE